MTKRSVYYIIGCILVLGLFSPRLAIAQKSTKAIKYQDLDKVKDPNIKVVRTDKQRIFEVRLVLDSAQRTPASLRLRGKKTYYYLDDKIQISIADVDTVEVAHSSLTSSYVLLIHLTPNGRDKWAAFTGANIKKQIGFIVNNRLIMAPHIVNKIRGGQMEIPDLKTLQEAEDLTRMINDAKGKARK